MLKNIKNLINKFIINLRKEMINLKRILFLFVTLIMLSIINTNYLPNGINNPGDGIWV